MERKKIAKELEKTFKLYVKAVQEGRKADAAALTIKSEELKLAFENAPVKDAKAPQKPYDRPNSANATVAAYATKPGKPEKKNFIDIIGPQSYSQLRIHSTNVHIFGELHHDINIRREKGEMSIVDYVKTLALKNTKKTFFLHENTFFNAADIEQVTAEDLSTVEHDGVGYYLAVPTYIPPPNPNRGRVMTMIKDGFREEILHPEKNINPHIEQVDIRRTRNMTYILNEVIKLARVGYAFRTLTAFIAFANSKTNLRTILPPHDEELFLLLEKDWSNSRNLALYYTALEDYGITRLQNYDEAAKKVAEAQRLINRGIYPDDATDPVFMASNNMAVYLMKNLMDFYVFSRFKNALHEGYDEIVYYCGDAHAETTVSVLKDLYGVGERTVTGNGRVRIEME